MIRVILECPNGHQVTDPIGILIARATRKEHAAIGVRATFPCGQCKRLGVDVELAERKIDDAGRTVTP